MIVFRPANLLECFKSAQSVNHRHAQVLARPRLIHHKANPSPLLFATTLIFHLSLQWELCDPVSLSDSSATSNFRDALLFYAQHQAQPISSKSQFSPRLRLPSPRRCPAVSELDGHNLGQPRSVSGSPCKHHEGHSQVVHKLLREEITSAISSFHLRGVHGEERSYQQEVSEPDHHLLCRFPQGSRQCHLSSRLG